VGQLDYTSEFAATIAKAEMSLTLLGQAGMFVHENSVDYRFLVHFESVAEWREYFDYWASYFEPMSAELIGRVEDLASEPGADIVLDTNCRSTVFGRCP
jgi:hypothetical protein